MKTVGKRTWLSVARRLCLWSCALLLPNLQALGKEPIESQSDDKPFADKAMTGTIEGVLTFSGEVPKSKVPDDAGDYRPLLDVERKSRGLRFVLICLELDESRTDESIDSQRDNDTRESEPVVMDQLEHRFVPHLLAIRAGQKVKFTNSDTANHNVRSNSFESKNQFNVFTGSGGDYSHQFVAERKLRPVKLSCDIHRWMQGWIYVLDHPYHAVTDKSGKFGICSIPPGKYRLSIRQPDVGYRQSREVELVKGKITKLQLNIDRRELKDL